MIRYILELPGGTRIQSGAGERNAIESVTLTESVNSGTELMLGSVCCTALEISIITLDTTLLVEANTEVTLYQLDDETNTETRIGVFKVEKPTKTSANRYKVTGYDRVSRLDKDVSAWLQGLKGWPYSIEELAQLVCNECGVALSEGNVPNGDFPVLRCPTTAAVTGRQIMQWIAEIAARFVTADEDGVLRFGWYTDPDISIGPSGDNYFFSGSLSYEGYTVEPIDAVKVRLADSEDGLLWPDGVSDNPYIVQGNKLLSLSLTETALPVLESMLTTLQEISYTPCKITVPIATGIKAGHIVTITDKNGATFSTPVMSAVRSGQQITFESTGSARRDSSENANTPSDDDLKEYAENAAGNAVKAQTQEEVFSRLTNNGTMKGVYMADGQLYINASYIKAGELLADLIKTGRITSQSGSGSNFVLDLDNGTVSIVSAGSGSDALGRLHINNDTVYISAERNDGMSENRVNLCGNANQTELYLRRENTHACLRAYEESANFFMSREREDGTVYRIDLTIDEDGTWMDGIQHIEGITEVLNPSSAANKAYVDNLFANAFPKVVAVANGGTGASTAEAARTNLGAAPSGYGYGESLLTIAASTEEEFENSLLTIATAMANHSTKQVKAMLSFLSFTTYSVVEIYKHSSGNLLIVTIRSPRNKGQTLQKVYSSSGWQPIEWYNPAMAPGSEYRTIERCGSEPVYRKRIVLEHTTDVGSSDGLTLSQQRIVHNLAFEKITEINAFAYCADGSIVPFQIDKITDTEFVIDTSHGVWKKPTYEITIAYTKPQ